MNSSGINANDAVAFRSSWTARLNNLQRYALAVVSVGLALGASLMLHHFGFRVPSEILLLFAVAISAWHGGPRPAVLALVLSVVSFYWYFIEPVRTIHIYWSEIPFFVTFVAFSTVLAWFGAVRQRVEADLRRSQEMLLEHPSVLGLTDKKANSRLPVESQGRFPALRLALIYAFFGALWILLSDRLSFYLVPDIQRIERMQTYKGWFFIAVTSVLLWSVARRFLSQVGAAEETSRRLNRKLQAVSDCNQALLHASDEQSLLDQICRIVCEEAGYRMAFVAYAEHDEAKTVRPVAWTGAEAGYLETAGLTWDDTERGRGPTGTAMRTGETCCVQDLATDPRVAPWTESLLERGFGSAIALPLKDEQAIPFGSLTIFSTQPNAFTPAEIALLEELAGDLAYGITTLHARAERERAQEALRNSERRYRTAEAVGHVGNWEFDVQTKRYWGSDEAKRMFGFDPGQTDFTTDEVENCIPERDRVHQALVDLIEASKPYNLEFEMRPRGSTEVRIISSVAQLMRDQQGNALKVVGSIRDITESKHAEHKIALLSSALNKVHDAAFLSDAKARFHYVNEEACRALGYTRAELLGMTVSDIDLQVPAERWPEFWLELKAQRTLTFESCHRTRDGRIYPVEIRGNYFEYGGGAYCLALVTDITERKRAEEALRRSEAYLSEAQRLTHTGAWATDSTPKPLYWSEELFRLYGLDPKDGVPTHEQAMQRVHPEDRDKYAQALRRVIHQKLDSDVEFRTVLPDGAIKYLNGLGHPVLNANGELVEVVGTTVDITERKRAEEALRLSNAYNRGLIEASLDPLVTIGPDGKITDVNAATEVATGRSRGELIGTDFCDYFTEPANARAGYEQVFRKGLVRDYPLELRHRDGRVMSVSYNAAVYRDESGEVVGVFAAARDITERKRAEEALRRNEAYLTEAQRLTHAGSWALDAATRELTYWSEEMFRIYGVHPQHGIPPMEAMGRRIHPEDRSRVHGTFEKSLREKVDTSEEYRLVQPSGTVKHVHVIRHPVLNTAGDIVELAGTFVDITERKLAEEERERLRQLESDLAHINRISMMGELAAAIAHEVNQPLSGIVSNASASLRFLAEDAPNLEEVREAVHDIVRDGKRAGEIIARIRALTKRTAAAQEKLDLNETIQEVLTLVGDEARRNRVMVRTQFADDLSVVAGDRVQLQQVVLNLVINAMEAMSSIHDRARELVISTRNAESEQVQVTVQDSGIGLDPDKMPKIFDPFYTTKPSGMGMGLSISRSILQAHGGQLWAAANDGPGTSFHFTLPKYHDQESNGRVTAA